MWTAITPQDVRFSLSRFEREAYQTLATDDDEQVIAEAIAAVVPGLQGYIADNPQNSIPQDITLLPERVHKAAVHLIRVELLTRLDLEVSEDRRKAADEALRLFIRIADGKSHVEQPQGATAPGSPTQTIDVINSKRRLATRENLKGL